ncbi:hypothetical protein KRR40_12940 [Niabella defluvii]|nr:hypothetical protein KRR40_12940 [Niabella sp. I65]
MQDSAVTMFESVACRKILEAINNSIMDTLRDFDDDKDKFEYGTDYIKNQIWALTQISNFIACAIPE